MLSQIGVEIGTYDRGGAIGPPNSNENDDRRGVIFDTEHDRAKVPRHNGNDPRPAPGSLKPLLSLPLLNKVQNKGTQGVQARHGAELPPFISIVQYPGRPVILGVEICIGRLHFDLRSLNGQIGTSFGNLLVWLAPGFLIPYFLEIFPPFQLGLL